MGCAGADALPSEMVEPAATAPAEAEAVGAAPVTSDAAEAGASTPANAVTETQKYARSGMTAAAEALIGQRLAQRMQGQRDHLESDLTLAELAGRIGTSPQLLSQYLNDRLGLSFFDYVNGLRVAEVQALLADPARAKTPVLHLALRRVQQQVHLQRRVPPRLRHDAVGVAAPSAGLGPGVCRQILILRPGRSARTPAPSSWQDCGRSAAPPPAQPQPTKDETDMQISKLGATTAVA